MGPIVKSWGKKRKEKRKKIGVEGYTKVKGGAYLKTGELVKGSSRSPANLGQRNSHFFSRTTPSPSLEPLTGEV